MLFIMENLNHKPALAALTILLFSALTFKVYAETPKIYLVGVSYPNMPNHPHFICAIVKAYENTVTAQLWIWNTNKTCIVNGAFPLLVWQYPKQNWYFILWKWIPPKTGNYTMMILAYYRYSQNYPPDPDTVGIFKFTIQNNTEIPSTVKFSTVKVK